MGEEEIHTELWRGDREALSWKMEMGGSCSNGSLGEMKRERKVKMTTGGGGRKENETCRRNEERERKASIQIGTPLRCCYDYDGGVITVQRRWGALSDIVKK
jgi:hypothetical protein